MLIELNRAEGGFCWAEGQERHMAFALFYKNDPDMLARTNSVEAHAFHCKAEMAAAKAIGTDARLVVRQRVMAGIVRSHGDDQWRLLVGMNEPPKVPLILVRSHSALCFEVLGWTLSGEARRPEWLSDFKGFSCFAVPASGLKPISTFPRDLIGTTPGSL